MKVYVVCREAYDDAGTLVEGVYATEELARQAIIRETDMIDLEFEYFSIQAHDLRGE